MLGSLFTFSALVASGIALPMADDTGMAAPQTRDASMPVEVSQVCYLSAADAAGCPTTSQQITGDADDGTSTGLVVYNKDSSDHSYFIYKNNCDCTPYKYITIPANGQKFIAFSVGFHGRMTRGSTGANLDGKTHKLGTWMEFSWDADGVGWADVSLIKGCDGAVTVEAIDGIGATTGFTNDVLSGAPSGAYKQKASGATVIMETESLTNFNDINTSPRDWLASQLGYTNAYIDDHHGNPDICSVNGRFNINFWPGRY